MEAVGGALPLSPVNAFGDSFRVQAAAAFINQGILATNLLGNSIVESPIWFSLGAFKDALGCKSLLEASDLLCSVEREAMAYANDGTKMQIFALRIPRDKLHSSARVTAMFTKTYMDFINQAEASTPPTATAGGR